MGALGSICKKRTQSVCHPSIESWWSDQPKQSSHTLHTSDLVPGSDNPYGLLHAISEPEDQDEEQSPDNEDLEDVLHHTFEEGMSTP